MASIEEHIPSIPWVEKENRRFIAILCGLDEAGWRRPTYCSGWSAADVVAHMTLGARFYAHVIPAGIEGRLEMPFGAKDLESFWVHRDRVGAELASLPGGERVDRFEEAVWNLQAVFEAVRPEDMEKEAWHWMCPCPAHSYPGQRLYELILHDWDLRNDPEGDLHPDALGAAVDILDFRLPFFFNHAPDPELTGTFWFETAGPVRSWAMRVEAGSAHPVSPEEGVFDAEIFVSASDILLLTTGRADPVAKKAAGRLRIEGDIGLADTLLGVLCRPF
ncbi:MAG: maleylpyruvate isomerase N-terminal domain-containing protein [Nitrospinota bacterium]